MSKQSLRAGVCVLLTDSVCVEVSVYVSRMSTSSVLRVTGAAGPRLFATPLTVKQNRVKQTFVEVYMYIYKKN